MHQECSTLDKGHSVYFFIQVDLVRVVVQTIYLISVDSYHCDAQTTALRILACPAHLRLYQI